MLKICSSTGCKGAAHKQDRHNCSVLVTLKLFIRDLNTWKINITGSHIPPEDNITWVPPTRRQLRIDEDVRDIVALEMQRNHDVSAKAVLERLQQDSSMEKRAPPKRKMSYFLSVMKKTRLRGSDGDVSSSADYHQGEVSGSNGTLPSIGILSVQSVYGT